MTNALKNYWAGIPLKKRTKLAREFNVSRWKDKTPEQKLAVGKALAKARKKAAKLRSIKLSTV